MSKAQDKAGELKASECVRCSYTIENGIRVLYKPCKSCEITALQEEVDLLNKREGIYRESMGEHCGEESTVQAISGMVWEIGTLQEQLKQAEERVRELEEVLNFWYSDDRCRVDIAEYKKWCSRSEAILKGE